MKANNLAHTRDGRVVSYLGLWDPTCKKRFELEIVGMDKDNAEARKKYPLTPGVYSMKDLWVELEAVFGDKTFPELLRAVDAISFPGFNPHIGQDSPTSSAEGGRWREECPQNHG